jgi:hypothetical protein
MTKQELIEEVIKRIKEDLSDGDETAIYELLEFTPRENLIQFLPEEKWSKFKSNLKSKK